MKLQKPPAAWLAAVLAGAAAILPVTAMAEGERSGNAPQRPPPASCDVFVVDDRDANFRQDLDTACTFRGGGPLVIEIPVRRYAGPTDQDGRLTNLQELLDNDLAAPLATLEILAFDVDNDARIPWPEIDLVHFNGVPVRLLYSGNRASLSGANGEWRSVKFKVPLSAIRFPPSRGTNGEPPPAAINTVRIYIDVLGAFRLPPEQSWCTAVDWVALSVKLPAPVALVHGLNSNPGIFERQGLRQELSETGLVSGAVTLPGQTTPAVSDAVVENGTRVLDFLRSFSAECGCDALHLVAHSKGGLDSREALARITDEDPRVISTTTLSTPHDGSVLADALVARGDRSFGIEPRFRLGFPAFTEDVARTLRGDPNHRSRGEQDLTQAACRTWGASNLDDLHWINARRFYSAIGGEADRDASRSINRNDEIEGMALEVPQTTFLLVGCNVLYQIVGQLSGVALVEDFKVVDRQTGEKRKVPDKRWIDGVRGDLQPNDILVSERSAFGQDTATALFLFAGPNGTTVALPWANHASVCGSVALEAVLDGIGKGELRR